MKKVCTKCNIEKEIFEFSSDKNTKSGVRSHCKVCTKQVYIRNKEKVLARQKEIYDAEKKRQYYQANLEQHSKNSKKYHEENKAKILLNKKEKYDPNLKKEYYEKNKTKLNKVASNRISEKRKNDCIFRLKHNIASLIRNGIKKKGYLKSKRTEEIIGCTVEELLNHLSSMFVEGMSFENHGEWHIDHIIPLVTAKTEEEVIKLNRYTNLQPLWAKDNLIKSGKYNENE
jgi:hypothetical protein